jgi:hypothetical protein
MAQVVRTYETVPGADLILGHIFSYPPLSPRSWNVISQGPSVFPSSLLTRHPVLFLKGPQSVPRD